MNNYIKQLLFLLTMSTIIIINLKFVVKYIKNNRELIQYDISNYVQKAIEINQFIYVNLINFKNFIDKITINVENDILPIFKFSFKSGLIGGIFWYFCCIILLNNRKRFFKFLEIHYPILLEQAKIL